MVKVRKGTAMLLSMALASGVEVFVWTLRGIGFIIGSGIVLTVVGWLK